MYPRRLNSKNKNIGKRDIPSQIGKKEYLKVGFEYNI